MAKRDPRMIPLGYGKFVRADRVYALVPLEGADRRDGRRTYVHVDGLTEPIVASRSERAILADVETALAGLPACRAAGAGSRPGRRACSSGHSAGGGPPPAAPRNAVAVSTSTSVRAGVNQWPARQATLRKSTPPSVLDSE